MVDFCYFMENNCSDKTKVTNCTETFAVAPEHAPMMNALTAEGSETDSDCEYKYVFPLRHEISPRDYLKFILTVWYSPETSAAIAGTFY